MLARGHRRPSTVFGAVALLVGTAVGAGIFGLPYVFSQAGVAIGIAYVLGLGAVLGLVNLAYGEVVLSTEGTHQFTAYVQRYLGQRWRIVAVLSLCIGLYGALSAYTLEVSHLLSVLLAPYVSLSQIPLGLIYLAVVGAALFIGLRAITPVEKILMIVMLSLITGLVVIGIPRVEPHNYVTAISPSAIFLPYGVVLFALSAASAVPDMKRVLQHHFGGLRRAIVIGSIIPVIVYIVFATVVVGITGTATTPSAVEGLGSILGPTALTIGAIFGCVTMTTSFLVSGMVLRETYQFDFKLRPWLAWVLVMTPPLLFLLFQWLSFIEILGISGALIGGLDGILIMHMHQRLRTVQHRPSAFTVTQSLVVPGLAYAVFIGGIVYEAWIIFQRLS